MLVFLLPACGTACRAGEKPVRIILDTDIGSDCDDVGAVALLHALADNGEAEILGMMVCNSAQWGPPCLDAINTYYGRPDVPIGAWKGPSLHERSRYHRRIAEKFPNDLKSARNAPDATDLYRRILSAQGDRSVVIVTVGTLNNLDRLLRADAKLVEKKVKLVSCMGGAYPGPGRDPNFTRPGAVVPSTINVVGNWPTPILFSGSEIGARIVTGARLAKETPADNPVRAAYGYYWRQEGKGRQSWDQTSVLAAVRGPERYWSIVKEGYNRVHENGSNQWSRSPDNKKHSYLARKMDPREVARIIEDLMVKPPASRKHVKGK